VGQHRLRRLELASNVGADRGDARDHRLRRLRKRARRRVADRLDPRRRR
jgi:hypothetical protein